MAVLCLTIGLRGLLTKTTFPVPSKVGCISLSWQCFLGPMVSLFFIFVALADYGLGYPLLMLPIMAVFMWIQLKGLPGVRRNREILQGGTADGARETAVALRREPSPRYG